MGRPPLLLLHLLLLLVVVSALSSPADAIWDRRPPECDDTCVEDDNAPSHARCAVTVLDDVVSVADADALVAAAEAHAAKHGWTRTRHANYPTTDLPWGALPGTWAVLNETWTRMEADVRARCGIKSNDVLTPNDIFLVKYDASEGGQKGLRRHRDGSTFSFNMMLSNPGDYGGGGTRVWNATDTESREGRERFWRAVVTKDPGRFPGVNLTRGDRMPRNFVPNIHMYPEDESTLHVLEKGQMLVGGGANVHQGVPVTTGTRYIVAGFVGWNRHCCSIKYCGLRGVIGFLRVWMLTGRSGMGGRADLSRELPQHDWILYREGMASLRKWCRRILFSLVAYCVVGNVAPSAHEAVKNPRRALRELRIWYRKRQKTYSCLPTRTD